MAWREVLSLEALAGRAVVHRILSVTERKIGDLLETVSRDAFKKHFNSPLQKIPFIGDLSCLKSVPLVMKESEAERQKKLDALPSAIRDRTQPLVLPERGESPGLECCDPSGGCALEKVKGKVQLVLTQFRLWWRLLPGAGPQHTLRSNLDTLTEVNPRDDHNFPRHLTNLCFKLLVLEEVFVDRDYGDRDKKCVVPVCWETWMADLLKVLAPFPVRRLSCYGAVYPSILESLVESSPNITELTLSHINITDDLLMTVSHSCPNLVKLYLQHCYPWMVLSIEGFCSAFFEGQSLQFLMFCLENKKLDRVKLSFPNLREVELSYGQTNTIREFHLLLLSLYKNVKLVYSEWKTNFFDEGYENYCEDVILDSISLSGALSIEKLFIKADYLHDLTEHDIQYLVWNCPLVREIRLDCKTSPARSTVLANIRVGEQLVRLATENKDILSLYVNVAREDRFTRSILLPFLVTRASTLTELTLEASSPFENISTSLLKFVMEMCQAITRLRVRVWMRSMLEFPSLDQERVSFPVRPSLKEVWLHEDGPGESDVEAGDSELWLLLLNALVVAAPNLQILSFTVCESLAKALEQLHSNVKSLHVHIIDGFEWQPLIGQLVKLVGNHPFLIDLYLEEATADAFWELKAIYSKTLLQLHWGNLEGWPRS